MSVTIERIPDSETYIVRQFINSKFVMKMILNGSEMEELSSELKKEGF